MSAKVRVRISRIMPQNMYTRPPFYSCVYTRQPMLHVHEWLNKNALPMCVSDYVKILEKESRDLKLNIRALEERVEMLPKVNEDDKANALAPGSDEKVSAMDNAYIRGHVQSLNDTIGALRSEKVTLLAHLKRLQARAAHLEGNVNQLQKQVQGQ